jgi:hypothetical protein
MTNSSKPYILAVDVGTSSLKAVLYNGGGAVVGSATRRYDYYAEQPGWADGNPAEWWAAFEGALADLQQQAFDLTGIDGISFTGQMHTAVLLDGAGQPLEPTILWLDRRAAVETAELTAKLQLPPYQINSTYTLPKLLWLKRHRPEVVEKIRTILWPKDYLRYRLTGELGTPKLGYGPAGPGGAGPLGVAPSPRGECDCGSPPPEDSRHLGSQSNGQGCHGDGRCGRPDWRRAAPAGPGGLLVGQFLDDIYGPGRRPVPSRRCSSLVYLPSGTLSAVGRSIIDHRGGPGVGLQPDRPG